MGVLKVEALWSREALDQQESLWPQFVRQEDTSELFFQLGLVEMQLLYNNNFYLIALYGGWLLQSRCIIVMPDDQASEKKKLLAHFGAKVVEVRVASIANPEHYVNVARRLAKEVWKVLIVVLLVS